MNCWLWIILLLCCGGNCGCTNNWCGSRRNRCEMSDCDSRRNSCGMNDCDMTYDQESYGYDRSDDCGCMQNDYDSNRSYERSARYDHGNDGCDCNENTMSYETYGCQENGIPCPPPIPTSYLR